MLIKMTHGMKGAGETYEYGSPGSERRNVSTATRGGAVEETAWASKGAAGAARPVATKRAVTRKACIFSGLVG